MSENRFASTVTTSPGPSRQLSTLSTGMVHLCALYEHADIDRGQFLEQCTRLVIEAIGCSRVGLWVFVETADGLVLRCVEMYDSVSQRMTGAPDELEHLDPYFLALKQPGCVMASDVRDHPAITGAFAERLKSRGVHSLLAASFSVNGAVYGAFTCTEVGRQSAWSTEQLVACDRSAPAPASCSFDAAATPQPPDRGRSPDEPHQPLSFAGPRPSAFGRSMCRGG